MPSRARSLLVLAALLTLVATAALRFGAGASDAAVSSTLHATVGPAFDISLTFDDGSAVGALPAGSYRVLVSDITTDHNFHLLGPGVDEATGVDFQGLDDLERDLPRGQPLPVHLRRARRLDVRPLRRRHRAASDRRRQPAGGGSAAAESGGGAAAAAAASRGHVVATLATLSRRRRLRRQAEAHVEGQDGEDADGRASTSSSSPTPSKTSAVKLVRTGGTTTTLTGVAFAGQKTVAVTLAAGQWKLFPSSRPSSAIAFRVTKRLTRDPIRRQTRDNGRMRRASIACLLAASCVLGLSACGGGGSGTSSTAATTTAATARRRSASASTPARSARPSPRGSTTSRTRAPSSRTRRTTSPT